MFLLYLLSAIKFICFYNVFTFRVDSLCGHLQLLLKGYQGALIPMHHSLPIKNTCISFHIKGMALYFFHNKLESLFLLSKLAMLPLQLKLKDFQKIFDISSPPISPLFVSFPCTIFSLLFLLTLFLYLSFFYSFYISNIVTVVI